MVGVWGLGPPTEISLVGYPGGSAARIPHQMGKRSADLASCDRPSEDIESARRGGTVMATRAERADARANAGLEPRGGRIGVTFDWGFGVQLATMGLTTLAGLPIAGMSLPRLAGAGML